MKTGKTLLLLIFLLACQTVFAQRVNSSVTIRIDRGKYAVSGVVSNDFVKNAVVEKIKMRLGGNVDFGKLTVRPEADLFLNDWQIELDKSLLKIKSWKSGVFIFSNQADKNYPPLPEKITNARFLLADGRSASLNDYKNKLVVLFFNETWNAPGNRQAGELNKFYPGVYSRRVEIISLSVETSPDEKKSYRELYKAFNIQYKFGWANEQMLRDFTEISKFPGIPQTFLIFNGKLHGIFLGSGPKTMEKLKETIGKTLDANNL
jgi:hypothetical protein